MSADSANFQFLLVHDPLLVRYGAQAERYFSDDPNTALIKLRQFAEVLAKHAAALSGVYTRPEASFVDVLGTLWDRGLLTPRVSELWHGIRKAGNAAAHEHDGTRRTALHQLKMARLLGVWFHRTFHDGDYKPHPFVPPPDPVAADDALREELAALRQDLVRAEAEAQAARLTATEEAERRAAAEAAAATAYGDLEAAMELAAESETRAKEDRAAMEARLAAAQDAAARAPLDQTETTVRRAQTHGGDLDLDEAATRHLIDQQLRDAGWEADTGMLRYARGTRPVKGRNLAIAEWPTATGPADYVLFIGLMPVAIVEAKRQSTDVPARIHQAKRYSRGFRIDGDLVAPGGPWGDLHVPFLFATNGRPFLRQLLNASGIWFLDARRPTNHPRALEGWYTPDGLQKLLAQDLEAADARLAAAPSDYLPLRDYQRAAIASVEQAIAAGQQQILLAMATGTGKTRTAICLIYRLLKAGRFRRVLFVVDRTSLGSQAHDSFASLKLEQLQSFTEIYDVKGLGDQEPETDTRLHIATIQGMVHRVLGSDAVPPVDTYDLIVVDECHRGYTLDRELSDAQLTFRNEADYISKYRRVLDHFDGVKVGLTATPALHTTEIFGAPVHTYSYRQAVVDGFLVDHEPPLRIRTKLGEGGIVWGAGEEIETYAVRTQQLDLIRTPDEVKVDIDQFNRRVQTEAFNRVVCEVLAEQIDPSLPGKTLVFCATDAHADLVVRLLKAAFDDLYGPTEDDAVQKITGAADRPGQRIRHFKNERNPRVAVTVDLLTTGIDVPEIVHLVFLRRVRSRILYEQMLGRATRLCPAIGKSAFRIYDAVDLYAALLPYSSMQPVVVNPKTTFVQLADELAELSDSTALREVADQLTAKLQRRKQSHDAEDSSFEVLAGMPLEDLTKKMKEWTPGDAAQWWSQHRAVADWLDRPTKGSGPVLLISKHPDERLDDQPVRGYGTADRPEDYLEAFGRYVREHVNEVPALLVVTQRPRELTRKQLKELKVALDQAGYTEARLRVAWRDATNQDIAATIIGHVRQQALGSPLTPYADRVKAAMDTVLASRAWTPPQRQWLERIGKQLLVETIVDREALDRGQFRAQGGFQRLNKVFKGELEQVLGDLNAALWEADG